MTPDLWLNSSFSPLLLPLTCKPGGGGEALLIFSALQVTPRDTIQSQESSKCRRLGPTALDCSGFCSTRAGCRELGPVPAGALGALVGVQAHRRQGLGTGDLVRKARAVILIASNRELWTHTDRLDSQQPPSPCPASSLWQPLGQPTLLQ